VLSAEAQHPTIGGYNVYYGDLHSHSNVSDGTGTPATAYSNSRFSCIYGNNNDSVLMLIIEWIKKRKNTTDF